MKNFLKVASAIDVMPLLMAVTLRPDLWNRHTLRTQHPGTAHSEVDDIWLRFNAIPEYDEDVIDDTECINYPAFLELPQARPLIFGLMTHLQGERLGRCLITRLKPGAKIAPHTDGGAPATYYDRFHIVLQSAPGCMFRAGDEWMHMRPGEAWWFDNTQEHEVLNNAADDRLHLIVDIRVSR